MPYHVALKTQEDKPMTLLLNLFLFFILPCRHTSIAFETTRIAKCRNATLKQQFAAALLVIKIKNRQRVSESHAINRAITHVTALHEGL